MAKVDVNALKFNQLNIIFWTILAVALDWPWLIALLGLCMAVGALWPEWGPFRLAYRRVVVPSGFAQPKVVADNPAPHRFALGFGAVVVLCAAGLLALGYALVGWVLADFVALLAFVNFAFNYCLGCQIYYWLGRLGVVRGGSPAS